MIFTESNRLNYATYDTFETDSFLVLNGETYDKKSLAKVNGSKLEIGAASYEFPTKRMGLKFFTDVYTSNYRIETQDYAVASDISKYGLLDVYASCKDSNDPNIEYTFLGNQYIKYNLKTKQYTRHDYVNNLNNSGYYTFTAVSYMYQNDEYIYLIAYTLESSYTSRPRDFVINKRSGEISGYNPYIIDGDPNSYTKIAFIHQEGNIFYYRAHVWGCVQTKKVQYIGNSPIHTKITNATKYTYDFSHPMIPSQLVDGNDEKYSYFMATANQNAELILEKYTTDMVFKDNTTRTNLFKDLTDIKLSERVEKKLDIFKFKDQDVIPPYEFMTLTIKATTGAVKTAVMSKLKFVYKDGGNTLDYYPKIISRIYYDGDPTRNAYVVLSKTQQPKFNPLVGNEYNNGYKLQDDEILAKIEIKAASHLASFGSDENNWVGTAFLEENNAEQNPINGLHSASKTITIDITFLKYGTNASTITGIKFLPYATDGVDKTTRCVENIEAKLYDKADKLDVLVNLPATAIANPTTDFNVNTLYSNSFIFNNQEAYKTKYNRLMVWDGNYAYSDSLNKYYYLQTTCYIMGKNKEYLVITTTPENWSRPNNDKFRILVYKRNDPVANPLDLTLKELVYISELPIVDNPEPYFKHVRMVDSNTLVLPWRSGWCFFNINNDTGHITKRIALTNDNIRSFGMDSLGRIYIKYVETQSTEIYTDNLPVYIEIDYKKKSDASLEYSDTAVVVSVVVKTMNIYREPVKANIELQIVDSDNAIFIASGTKKARLTTNNKGMLETQVRLLKPTKCYVTGSILYNKELSITD